MSIRWYHRNAEGLVDQYEAADPERVNRSWRHLLPEQPGLTLDVGAGSGRDAAWLRALGWEVVAAEPCEALRDAARRHHGEAIHWLDDRLPDLNAVRALNLEYRLILISGVWMHVPPKQRERAFRILTDLLAPGGQLVISLRQGPAPMEQGFHPVDPDELRALASRRAVDLVLAEENVDALGRDGVSWKTLVFRMPDDGTGGLPVLRNIIVNDNKAATYKLGLLRALVRCADGSPGLVLGAGETHVTVPFGLVALNWLKLYLPLVCWHGMKQVTGGRPGFAKEHFQRLGARRRNDIMYYLRPGMHLPQELAGEITPALNLICDVIAKMPARYTTWPGTDNPVFECRRHSVRRHGDVILERDYLAAFGEFRVPRALWRSMLHHACWLEPAINQEWASLMQYWEGHVYDAAKRPWYAALEWEEARRDTKQVRAIVDERLQQGRRQPCVWTASPLRADRYEVDHCLPWSRWYNNDLWNLMPATRRANHSKREQLPSADLLHEARGRILDWWNSAYNAADRAGQFHREASASLPLDERPDLEEIFNALLIQRTRLKVDQQIREWGGL